MPRSRAHCPVTAITVARYAEAYRAAGREADRQLQLDLTTEIGRYLDRVVRKPMVRTLVKLARGPAHAAGFGLLQETSRTGARCFRSDAWRRLNSSIRFGNGKAGR